MTGGAVEITMSDIRGLQPGTYINDAIIDVVMAGIEEEARQRSGVKADLYVTSLFLSMLLSHDSSASRLLTKKLKSNEGDKLFTIVNTRKGSHWVAVELNFKSKKVTIMDSFRPKQGHEDCLELAMIGKTLQVWADKEGKFVQEGKGGAVSSLVSLRSTLPWT